MAGGRPAIGPEVHGIRVPQAMLDRIDRLAAEAALTRAAFVRRLLQLAMDGVDYHEPSHSTLSADANSPETAVPIVPDGAAS